MSTLEVERHPQAHNVICTDAAVTIELLDGRTISAPLVWFPKLAQAKKEQLDNWESLGDGSNAAINGMLDPEGIEIAKQRDRDLSSGSVKPISHSEFLRRISSNE